ncbi:MAG: hypothetical protein FD175_1252 [Beijerinckiaceae bacterium]|nr:MAG: hypothetical protein FD175_1252 [Beijerinckiaceae bacterium]
MNGVKDLPDIVALMDTYWIVSSSGKEFLEENAPNQCEFIPTEVWRNKKSASRRSETSPDVQIEKDYFWLNIVRRFDAIAWDQSQARLYEFDGEDWDTKEKKRVKRVKFPDHPTHSHLKGCGLTIRKDVIGDSQIWRDNFSGAGFVGLTFMSDDLKLKIERNKLGRIFFIPVKEV